KPLGRNAAAPSARAPRGRGLSQRRGIARERRARAPRARAARRADGDGRGARVHVGLRAAGQPRRRRAARARGGRGAKRPHAAHEPGGGGRAVNGAALRAAGGTAWVLLVPLMLGAALLSLVIGRTSTGPTLGFGDAAIAGPVLMEIRLPRTLLALLVGGTLGLSGAALQGLLRNPLAEPGLLGASSGAALGAVLVFYFGLAAADSLVLPLGGVAGSVAALGLLYGLAGRRADLVTIVLAGIAINALAAALTSLALNFAPSPYAALEILFWMLGSLADRSAVHVWLALPLMLPGWLLIGAAARGLDALTL